MRAERGVFGKVIRVVEMANGNMANGKFERKAPEKTGAFQKLRRLGGRIRYSPIFVRK